MELSHVLRRFCNNKVFRKIDWQYNIMQENSEIILYQPEKSIRLEVRLEDETVWLTQQQRYTVPSMG